jgi:hypothetical protein
VVKIFKIKAMEWNKGEWKKVEIIIEVNDITGEVIKVREPDISEE